ncbi:MAG: DUF3426 domain-containing protein [Pseudomonadota bacterium]
MYTRCPNCNAAFSITGQQLVIAAGMVRCGICEHVFDARPHLFQEPSTPPEIDVVLEEPSSDIKQDKLSKDDLGLIDETIEIREENPSEENIQNLFNQTFDQEESEIPDIIADDVSNLVDKPTSASRYQVLGIILIWLLLSVLAVQLIAVYKPNTFPMGWKSTICSWLTCVEHVASTPDKIEILNRSVHTHPHEDNALMATLTIVNRADYPQSYPIIQLRFLDISGSVISARLFDANQYLGNKWNQDTILPPNTPISIQLELQDTGEQVVSYDFEFL